MVTVVVIVHILALALLIWAIRGRVPRSGVRCPACWYDMAGVPPEDGGLQCPECGRRAPIGTWARPGQRWPYRYRPRKAIVAAILIQLAAGYWWQHRRPGYESWTGLMPDWALMRLVREYPRRDLIVSRSLEHRFNNGHLSRAHMVELCERFLGADPATAQNLAATRPRWVIGIPVVFGLSTGGGWWSPWGIAGVDGREMWPKDEWPDIVDRTPYSQYEPPHPLGGGLVLGPAAQPGLNHIPVTMENTVWLPPRDRWAQRVESSVTFQGVDSIEQCMTPLDSPAARQRITEALAITFRRPIEGETLDELAILRFAFDLRPVAAGPPPYTIAVRITIEHEGRVLAEFRDHKADINGPLTPYHVRERYIGGEDAWDPIRRNRGRDLDLTGVIVRIRPDPQGVLTDLARTSFWSGEIVLEGSQVITIEPPMLREE